MKTAKQIRRDNLRQLLLAHGGPAGLARRMGKSDRGSTFSQIAGPNPTRDVGDQMARELETVLGLAVGWMDRDHAGSTNVEDAPESRGTVPVISWVAAGSWNGADDPLHPGEAERWLECPVSHSERTYALRVRGDSMTAPYGSGRTYPEGCIIFVDPLKKSPVNGARIIAKLEGTDEVTFKVFKQEDGRTWLAPLNPSHEPIRDPFRVLGTVIGKWEDE